MDRRRFLRTLGGAAAALASSGAVAHPGSGHAGALSCAGGTAAPMTHWAWMRSDVKAMDDWRRLLARLRSAGIGSILIGGSADFYRRIAPLVRDEGLELHAWLFTLMRGEHVKTHPEWYAVSRSGVSTAERPPYVGYYRFMCPSRPEVREWVARLVSDIASVEGLAGVHLDYIRYPDVILPVALWPKYKLVQDKEYPEFDFCYCAVCRDRFKQQSGIDPAGIDDPAAHRDWLQYRYDTITRLVAELADLVHRRGRQITAAVFPTPSIARALVRQEWTKWKLDAALPMVYQAFYKEDVAWIERATREGVDALGGRIPLYSGLYVPDLPPADLGLAVDRALAGGARGVSIFQGDTLTPAHFESMTAALKRAASRVARDRSKGGAR